jgi:hypothetical protein
MAVIYSNIDYHHSAICGNYFILPIYGARLQLWAAKILKLQDLLSSPASFLARETLGTGPSGRPERVNPQETKIVPLVVTLIATSWAPQRLHALFPKFFSFLYLKNVQ